MNSKSVGRLTRRWGFCAACLGLALCGWANAADEAIFSGPQVGEALRPFKVVGVYDQDAGKEHDFIAEAKGGPLMLIFVHEFNRPSAGLMRVMMTYAKKRHDDGLFTGVIRLDDDITAATEKLKVARHALVDGIPIGISADGAEGPGSYGLNRNVQLTIIVADKNKVTGNFALVQPSVQADSPRIIAEIIKLIGGEIPSLAELGGQQYMNREKGKRAMQRQRPNAPAANEEPDEQLVGLLRQVINKSASPQDVEQAAKKLEEYIKGHESARLELGRRTSAVVNSDVFEQYGTPKAREFMSKWAKQYGPKDSDAKVKKAKTE